MSTVVLTNTGYLIYGCNAADGQRAHFSSGLPGRLVKKILYSGTIRPIVKIMADLKFEVPVTEEVEVDAETLAAIDRGIQDANEGRTVSVDEVRELVPRWISRFESQQRH